MDKKRKNLLCSVLSIAALSISLSVLFANGNNVMKAKGSATWYHFSSTTPTESTRGNREYWSTCLASDDPVLTEPAGDIVEKGQPTEAQLELFEDDDPRLSVYTPWKYASSGSSFATTNYADNGNVVLTADLASGDTEFKERSVSEDYTYVSYALTFGEIGSTSIWYKFNGSYQGLTPDADNSTYVINVDRNTYIIFRNTSSFTAEVIDSGYLTSYIDVGQAKSKASSAFKQTTDEDGLIRSFSFATDGKKSYENNTGFSNSYIQYLKGLGYKSITFTYTRDGGDLGRMWDIDGTASYPSNGEITVDISGSGTNGIHFDAPANGGAAAAATISITNITYSNAKKDARAILANKITRSTYWNYFRFGAGEYVSGGSVSVTGKNFTMQRKLISLMRTAEYRYLDLSISVSGDDSIYKMMFQTQTDAWNTYYNDNIKVTTLGEAVHIVLDISNWSSLTFDETTLESTPIAEFSARDSSNNDITTDLTWNIRINGYYEDSYDATMNLSGTPQAYADTFDYTQDIYVRFAYLPTLGSNTRCIIWGKTSATIVNANNFADATSLASVDGYWDGWYEFKIKANSLDSDGVIYFSADKSNTVVLEISYTSAVA